MNINYPTLGPGPQRHLPVSPRQHTLCRGSSTAHVSAERACPDPACHWRRRRCRRGAWPGVESSVIQAIAEPGSRRSIDTQRCRTSRSLAGAPTRICPRRSPTAWDWSWAGWSLRSSATRKLGKRGSDGREGGGRYTAVT